MTKTKRCEDCENCEPILVELCMEAGIFAEGICYCLLDWEQVKCYKASTCADYSRKWWKIWRPK